MWIRKMDLTDFGCFQKAYVDGLDSGLVVVGGLQRAGKTTFMHALRCLGYGVPRSGNVPPAASEYDLSAQVRHNNSDYRISVEGYATPSVETLDGNGTTAIDDLYGHIDSFHYNQLFTISLDQLKQLPAGVDSDERENLNAALLGAGWADVVRIPELLEDIRYEANKKLGGVNGTAYQMGDVLDRIKQYVEELEEAKKQVDQYRSVEEQITDKENKLADIVDQRNRAETRRRRLETLKEYLPDFRTYRERKRRLESSDLTEQLDDVPEQTADQAEHHRSAFEEATNELRKARDEFRSFSTRENPEEQKNILLERRQDIESYNNQLSGWREKRKNLNRTQKEIEKQEQDLRNQVQELHPDWSDLTDLEAVRTDLVADDKLKQTVDEVTELDRKCERLEEDRRELQEEIEQLKQTEGVSETVPGGLAPGSIIVLLGGLSLFSLIVAVLLSEFVSTALGVVSGLVLLGGSVGFLYYYATRHTDSRQTADGIRSRIQSKKQRLENINERLEERSAEWEEKQETLSELKDQLGLPADVSPDATMEFYRRVSEATSDLSDLKQKKNQLRSDEEEFVSTLLDAAHVLDETVNKDLEGLALPESAGELFSAVERANDLLDRADEWREAERKRNRIRKKIDEFISRLPLSTLSFEPPDQKAPPEEVNTVLMKIEEKGKEIENLREGRRRMEEAKRALLSALNRAQVREAFAPYLEETQTENENDVDDENVLSAFQKAAEEYPDPGEVESALKNTNLDIEELREEENQLRDKLGELRARKDALSTDEEMLEARHGIERERTKLRPMAERWATLRIAAILLEKLHSRFVEKAAGPVLERASDRFEEITGKDYSGVQPSEDGEVTEFHAERSNGETQTARELSRGTKEQLFLSIRLSRIQEIEPRLPVILDDSAVNFDPAHRHRVTGVLGELAEQNQIFLLTSHPEMVEHVAEVHPSADWYYLNQKHRFEDLPDGPDELINRLVKEDEA